MRNYKLDRICAKRLHSKDFAQGPQKHMPTSNFEVAIIILLVIVTGLLMGYQAYVTYFA